MTADTSSFGNSDTNSSIPLRAAANPFKTMDSFPANPVEPTFAI